YDPVKNVDMVAIPATEYSFTTMIDFNSPVLGTQHISLNSLAEYKQEIASCRTFSFLHELEYLLDHNLIKGGDLNNAIVVVDKPISSITLNKHKKVIINTYIDINKKSILNILAL